MAEKKTIQEITGEEEITKIISKLKTNNVFSNTDLEKIVKKIDVAEHDVFDINKRRDKLVELDDKTDLQAVNRIGIPFQRRIVNTSVAFAFGNPVKWTLDSTLDEDKKYFDSFLKVLKKAKYDSVDKMMCSSLKTYTESAELWYAVEGDSHEKYGFKTSVKIKCLVLDYDNSMLYPYFDEYGDLLAFSREYKIKENNLDVTYLDVYTASQVLRFKQSNEGFQLASEPKENKLGKIQIVYINQKKTEYEDVLAAIERLELIVSNHAETNDYHSSPTLFAHGEMKSFVKKGEQGKFIEGETGSELEYVTWDSAPESMKLEIENLYKIIFEFTQTPNFSFEQVKGLGSISGVSLKLMFLDAHLKVVHDKVIYDAWMERRKSIILSYLGQIDSGNKSKYESLDISHEIRPYMIDDRKGLLEEILLANGNNKVVSMVRGMQMFGDIPNPEEEYQQILKEEEQMNTSNLFAPAQ